MGLGPRPSLLHTTCNHHRIDIPWNNSLQNRTILPQCPGPSCNSCLTCSVPGQEPVVEEGWRPGPGYADIPSNFSMILEGIVESPVRLSIQELKSMTLERFDPLYTVCPVPSLHFLTGLVLLNCGAFLKYKKWKLRPKLTNCKLCPLYIRILQKQDHPSAIPIVCGVVG